jgi:hypothetical protein
VLNRFVGGMAIVRVRSRRKEHGRTNASSVLYIANWPVDTPMLQYISPLLIDDQYSKTAHAVREWNKLIDLYKISVNSKLPISPGCVCVLSHFVNNHHPPSS